MEPSSPVLLQRKSVREVIDDAWKILDLPVQLRLSVYDINLFLLLNNLLFVLGGCKFLQVVLGKIRMSVVVRLSACVSALLLRNKHFFI